MSTAVPGSISAAADAVLGAALRRPFALRVASRGGTSVDVAVRELRGVEELSCPFRFDVTGLLPEDVPSAADLLGGAAALTLVGPRGDVRALLGIVARVRASARGGRNAATLRIVPRLWLLGRSKNSRVFQDQTVPDIIRAVLASSAIDCEVSTSRAYAPRPYCVQYQESDLAFLSRIAAEEGMFFFFRHPPEDGQKEVVVFGDAASHYRPIAGVAKVPIQLGGALAGAEHVRSFSLDDRLRSGATLVRAYDAERPRYDLHGTATARARGALDETQVSTYRHDADPAERVDDQVAARLLESVRRRASGGEGASTCMAFQPGHVFELDGHPLDALNAGFALTRLEHEGAQGVDMGDVEGDRYENRFRCLPATIAFRPKQPVRRLQQTTETALVVGPSGEEIHVDAEGRVKVQFPWDRLGKNDDHSSCWIRTMQPWAGASWGFQFIPRVGMEVVVLFVAGDVDRPMIAGAVANGVNPFPYALPAHKTQSGVRTRSSPGGAGSNELRFEDAAGSEQIYLHAQRNLDELVGNDHTRTVEKGETIQVGADRSLTIGGSQKRAVTSNDELEVGQNRTMEVGGDHVRVVNGNEIVEIGKNLVLHIKGKQILKIDGQDAPGGAKGPAISPPKPDLKTTSVGSPDGAGAPSRGRPTRRRPALGDRAACPRDLYPRGAALRQLGEELEPTLVAMQGEANGLLTLLKADGANLAPSIERAANGRIDQAAEVLEKIAAAEKEAADAPAELDDVKRAFSSVAKNALLRVDTAEKTAKAAQAGAREVLAAASGSGGGGGGADPQWSTPSQGDYKGSSMLDITGDAVIKSSTKLTLVVGGSSVVIEDGQITVNSKVVTVTGSSAISIHSGGLVKVEGTPITLN